jgi:hypothetical protein
MQFILRVRRNTKAEWRFIKQTRWGWFMERAYEYDDDPPDSCNGCRWTGFRLFRITVTFGVGRML